MGGIADTLGVVSGAGGGGVIPTGSTGVTTVGGMTVIVRS
jgi:hypothetical protein